MGRALLPAAAGLPARPLCYVARYSGCSCGRGGRRRGGAPPAPDVLIQGGRAPPLAYRPHAGCQAAFTTYVRRREHDPGGGRGGRRGGGGQPVVVRLVPLHARALPPAAARTALPPAQTYRAPSSSPQWAAIKLGIIRGVVPSVGVDPPRAGGARPTQRPPRTDARVPAHWNGRAGGAASAGRGDGVPTRAHRLWRSHGGAAGRRHQRAAQPRGGARPLPAGPASSAASGSVPAGSGGRAAAVRAARQDGAPCTSQYQETQRATGLGRGIEAVIVRVSGRAREQTAEQQTFEAILDQPCNAQLFVRRRR